MATISTVISLILTVIVSMVLLQELRSHQPIFTTLRVFGSLLKGDEDFITADKAYESRERRQWLKEVV